VTITEMDDVFSFSGLRASRKIKVRKKGMEDAAALVKKLAGEDDS
jgi:3-methyladenine DNA glycosylase AlkD